jgi:hypothetical protein
MHNITIVNQSRGAGTRLPSRSEATARIYLYTCQCTFSLCTGLGETAAFFHLSTASNLFKSDPVYNFLEIKV